MPNTPKPPTAPPEAAPQPGPACGALAAAQALAAQLGQTIALSETLIRQHRRVDLTGLDGEIGRLCAATLDLGLEQGRTLLPSLHALHQRLGEMSAALAIAAPEA